VFVAAVTAFVIAGGVERNLNELILALGRSNRGQLQ
jgi:hypothetical protein